MFLLLIAAHLCGDVLSYSRFLSGLKRSERLGVKIGGIGLHCFIHGLFVLVWLWPLPWGIRLWAAVYIFVTHFIIDFARTPVERALIDKRDFRILKRSDPLFYFLGKGNPETRAFMKKYLGGWTLANVIDQSLHITAIAIFALLV